MLINEEYNQYIELVSKLPFEIKEQEQKLMALNRKIDAIEKSKKELELVTYAIVTNEKEESGTKKYTNDKQREAEVNARLKLNPEYKLKEEEENEAITKINETKTELEFLRNQFKSIQTIVEILKIKINLR